MEEFHPSDGRWCCLRGNFERVVDVGVERIVHPTVNILSREVVVLLNRVPCCDVHGLLTRICFRRDAIRFESGREFRDNWWRQDEAQPSIDSGLGAFEILEFASEVVTERAQVETIGTITNAWRIFHKLFYCVV